MGTDIRVVIREERKLKLIKLRNKLGFSYNTEYESILPNNLIKELEELEFKDYLPQYIRNYEPKNKDEEEIQTFDGYRWSNLWDSVDSFEYKIPPGTYTKEKLSYHIKQYKLLERLGSERSTYIISFLEKIQELDLVLMEG